MENDYRKNDFGNYLDQGALNCIIYDKKLFSDCLIPQGNLGPVMTIGLSQKQYIVLDKMIISLIMLVKFQLLFINMIGCLI